jgi:hypothetical protein
MENHPIPQDVTGFQFKLIGDMTIKQFAFVAAGAILAFVIFYLPIPFGVRLPLCVLFALSGAGLAFAPIEGRPADLMAGYFLKALLTPNQYAYHKLGGSIMLFSIQSPQYQAHPSTHARQTISEKEIAKNQQLQTYLQSVHQTTASPLDQKEALYLQHILTPQTSQLTPPVPSQGAIPTPQISTPSPTQNADATLTPQQMQEEEAHLSLEAASIKYALNEAKEHEAKEKDAAKITSTHQQVLTLEDKLHSLLAQKEALEKELNALKAASASLTQQPVDATPQAQAIQTQPTSDLAETAAAQLNPAVEAQQTAPVTPLARPAAPIPTPSPTVRKIPADMAKSIGLPRMPDVPNLIVGIVKDPRGNILQNILVEVKDKDGIPARAFRTNSLGQFASATPLSNGSYTIEFEDPKLQHKFDIVEIIAQGEIMLPLEIISHDEREELRKALFN